MSTDAAAPPAEPEQLYPVACLRIVDKTNTHRRNTLMYGKPPIRIEVEEACRDFIADHGLAEKDPVAVVKWRLDYSDTNQRPREGYVASSRRKPIEPAAETTTGAAAAPEPEKRASETKYDDGI